jgi:hypothetical protein
MSCDRLVYIVMDTRALAAHDEDMRPRSEVAQPRQVTTVSAALLTRLREGVDAKTMRPPMAGRALATGS